MYMVVNQFLSADVKTWVKTIHLDSWVRLRKEMIAYYVDPLEEDRAWNYLNLLQQTGSVKDYSEKFLQLIVKVGNNVQVKSAAEALDFELWRSRRKTNPALSSTTWNATKPTTGASSSGAATHHKAGRYPVPVNAMRNSHKLSKEDTARYLSENLCFGCGKSGHMARACPDKRKDKREAPEEN
jgi:Retrotransposon gag protein/Zinc knuckle